MMAEAKLLRQHKGRLEARMQILEDHNRQLEAQLQRLRQLLDEVSEQFSGLVLQFCTITKNIQFCQTAECNKSINTTDSFGDGIAA